jgi:hypothetical protein
MRNVNGLNQDALNSKPLSNTNTKLGSRLNTGLKINKSPSAW